ncbi:hypothetical protein REPUB_Repub03eG0176700 [Reevesia pubescens]
MRIAFISVLSAAVLILGLSLVLYLWRKRYPKKPGLVTFVPESSFNVKNQKEDSELPLFDLAMIVHATDNFSMNNKLGEDETHSVPLDWPMRYNIINGIARGLLYLHQDSRQRIMHRDLKASNVLLDNEMNPKISDFGLARSFGEKETEANTKKVVGTYGYMAPEYAIDGHNIHD